MMSLSQYMDQCDSDESFNREVERYLDRLEKVGEDGAGNDIYYDEDEGYFTIDDDGFESDGDSITAKKDIIEEGELFDIITHQNGRLSTLEAGYARLDYNLRRANEYIAKAKKYLESIGIEDLEAHLKSIAPPEEPAKPYKPTPAKPRVDIRGVRAAYAHGEMSERDYLEYESDYQDMIDDAR